MKVFRTAPFVTALLLSVWAPVSARAADAGERIRRIDGALAAAGQFLLAQQQDDGAWRSKTYGFFKAGPSLTPLILSSLYFLPQAGRPNVRAAYRKGVVYLSGFVGSEGRLRVGPRELLFPVYTAASASRVVALEQKTPANLVAQQAWLAYLRSRQLNEHLGWRPADKEYGGWGFSMDLPRKPRPGQLRERFFESNLAATVFALAALRSAKVPPDDPAYSQAIAFVRRCQNFPEQADKAAPAFDDGGFFFIPDDPVQNKAGPAGRDRAGRLRFNSYGTMTADGLRSLLRCGLKGDHPRVVASRRWLEKNFSAKSNPGTFAPDRKILRDATYYYWAWAVSHAFLAVRVETIRTPAGRVRWAEELADELLRRRRSDGTWVNRFTAGREDDPLVATPFAAAALAICRGVITRKYASLGDGCPGMSRPPQAGRPGPP